MNEFVTHLALQSPVIGLLAFALWKLWNRVNRIDRSVAEIKGYLKGVHNGTHH